MLIPCLSLHAADTSKIWKVSKLLRTKTDLIPLRDNNDAILKRVQRKQLLVILKAMSDIEAASERKALLTIIKGDRPNASAGPVKGQDMILINFAMLDMIGNDRDQWAALLGHEMAHLKLNHSGKAMKRRVPLKLIELAVRASTDNKWSRTATGVAATAIDTKYSRDHERESDYLGLIWAVEKGYDPQGAVALHTEFSKLSKGISIPFLQSHRSSKERIKRLSRLADQLASDKEPEPIELERDPFESVELLKVGMVTVTVEHLMGKPVDKDFSGNQSEWHYCKTGQQIDEFISIEFRDEKLHALQKYTVTLEDGGAVGPCELNLKRGTYSSAR